MKIHYLVEIENPHTHMVKVTLKGERKGKDQLHFFLPSWSPGSYLMREYGRHVRMVRAVDQKGARLWVGQTAKGSWLLDFEKEPSAQGAKEFTFTYEVYCHELTVRTSHIDAQHAFLHGPTYLMGILGEKIDRPTLEIKFPPLWSKVTTALEDVSKKREMFLYAARDYDELIDTPIELGCQETDGFRSDEVNYFLSFTGNTFPHQHQLKDDIRTVVETVNKMMGEVPFTQYAFLIHFAPGLYGGLEHLNSTALLFDGTRLSNRDDYIAFLALVAHEYFHAWNVKRIRPKELGPFDYLNENYTGLLWLAEGLTSFMDDYFVYRAGLCTFEEYLKVVGKNFNRYFQIPGRKFHSLEDSSFNAWVKLYRPDENTNNSSVSYYLKGGLVFMALHILLVEREKSIESLLELLWASYKRHPERGLVSAEVFAMVEALAGSDVREEFENMVTTTFEIPFETILARAGLELKWDAPKESHLGINLSYKGDRVEVASVELDGPAFKSGLNAMDEILAINGLRLLKDQVSDLGRTLMADQPYRFLVSRLGHIREVEVLVEKKPQLCKELVVKNVELVRRFFPATLH